MPVFLASGWGPKSLRVHYSKRQLRLSPERNASAPFPIKDAMPKPLSNPLTYYPAYCFSLSPTHNTWARLFASDVHALRERTGFEGTPVPFTYESSIYPCFCFWASKPTLQYSHRKMTDIPSPKPPGQNLYFHLNHPIKWIRLVGVIVALDLYPTRWIALLDDSSGATIEITCGLPAPSPTTRRDANATSLAEVSTNLSASDAFTKGVTATGRDVDLSGVDIGTVVKVKGGVGSFREARQMLLERICRSTTPPPPPPER